MLLLTMHARLTSLVPTPRQLSVACSTLPYCKRREAGRGPGNEAKVNYTSYMKRIASYPGH